MYDGYGNNHGQGDANAPPAPKKVVRFDSGYVKTLPGILKVVELSCNLIGFICIKVANAWVSAVFYNLLYWIGNAVTALLLCMYLFHIVEKYDRWPWHKIEFFFCAAMSIGYIVTSIFAATIGDSAGYACTFFGICALIAYGLDGYLKFKGWRRGLPPQ